MSAPLATHDYTPGALDAALEFLKRTRWELRSLRKARVWADRLQIYDVNGDYFELGGVGYAHPDLVALLRVVNAAYDPDTRQVVVLSSAKPDGVGDPGVQSRPSSA